MQDIAGAQQLLKAHILRPGGQLRAQRPPVVVLHAHAQRRGPLLHFPPDAAHAQDAQQFALRVVAQRRGGGASPRLLPQRQERGGEVAEGAEEQEQRGVGGGGVDGGGHVGDPDRARVAGGDVDLVVAGACGGGEKGGLEIGVLGGVEGG